MIKTRNERVVAGIAVAVALGFALRVTVAAERAYDYGAAAPSAPSPYGPYSTYTGSARNDDDGVVYGIRLNDANSNNLLGLTYGMRWREVNAYGIGASYVLSKSLTLSAGYGSGLQTLPGFGREYAPNGLSPLPMAAQGRIALGATWAVNKRGDLSLYYMHAFDNLSATGNGANGTGIPGLTWGNNNPGGVRIKQDALGLSFGWKIK